MHGSPCVTADSLILTKDGYKPIIDVHVGDEVLTKSNVWQKVVKKFDNGAHQTCYLDGMGFENIHCTLNHKFYVREMYRKGHKSIRCFKEPVFKMAKDLTKKDYFGVPVIQDEKPFYTNECDFWYMLGMYLGDGWLSKTTNDIIIACNDIKLEKLKTQLNQEKWKYTYYKERTCYKFRFSNKKIHEFIEKYIGTGSNKKIIPYEILCLPKVQLQNFYDGYLDSDGCIVNERHQFSSINRNLIYSISLIINKLYKRPTGIYKIKVKNTKKIEGRLVNQKDWYLLRFNPNKKMQDKAFYEDGYVWYPFNKLVMAEKENVYNMEVEKDHSYIVQGCISKNYQDFSLAGKQAGGDEGSGTRSSLMYETIRIVKKLRPKYVIWENVKNLLSAKHKHNFDAYLKTMEDLGYINYHQVLNAKDYGIPQNRERVFTISIYDDIDYDTDFEFPKPQELKLKLKDMLEDDVDEKYYLSDAQINRIKTSSYISNQRRIQEKDYCDTLCARDWKDPKCVQVGNLSGGKWDKIYESCRRVYSTDGISPTISTCQGGNTEPKVCELRYDEGIRTFKNNLCGSLRTIDACGNKCALIKKDDTYDLQIRKLTPKECWRLMGFDDSDFEKAEKVNSNSQLYKQAGNSIVVNVLEEILKNLLF